jgi:hypothetical protein
MRALTVLAIPIYQSLGKQYPNLTERREATRQYLLEITHWTIKELIQGNNYFFKPVEFNPVDKVDEFQVRLIYDTETKYHELKFGKLNAENDEEAYEWDDDDPQKLLKALFLHDVLNKKVIPLLKSNSIEGIQYKPYDGDGLGDERLSYFNNMYMKLGKDHYSLKHNPDIDKYVIIKH